MGCSQARDVKEGPRLIQRLKPLKLNTFLRNVTTTLACPMKREYVNIVGRRSVSVASA